MRLTLRTLLAWLDDTLKPAQVKEIGSQVAESSFAQELMERIHRVSRQRRLSVPSSSGPDGADPNVVASYLDNELDADAVAEYEKQCLTTDTKLAEVASVHQILSLLGQKVKVPAEARVRMYQLVRGRETVPQRSAAGRGREVSEPLTRPIPVWVDPDSTQRSWIQRSGLVAASLFLIALSILTGSWSLTMPSAEPVTLPIAINPPKVDQAERQVQGKEEAALAVASGAPTQEVPSPAPALAVAADGHEPATEPTSTAEATGTAATPSTSEAAGKKDKSKETMTNALEPKPTAVPPGAVGVADAMAGILLRYNVDLREWERLLGQTPVNKADRLLCLWPFRAGLNLSNVPVTIIGDTEVRILSVPADKIPAIELLQGRLLLRNLPEGSFKVGFSGRMITADVPSSATVVFERPDHREYGRPITQPAPLVVYCIQGAVSVTVDQKQEALTASERLVIEASGTVARGAIDSPPQWATETEPSPVELRLREQFSRMFHPGRPVLTEIVIASESDASDVRQLAILALKSIGELSLLMPMLSREGDAVTRKGALDAIRAYMALGPEATARVRDQLAEEFGDDTAAFVERMLVGYTADQAADPKLYERLVAALGPEQQSVGLRELALDTLKTLTGRDSLDYDPDHPEGKGLKAWKDLVREGKLHYSAPHPKTE